MNNWIRNKIRARFWFPLGFFVLIAPIFVLQAEMKPIPENAVLDLRNESFQKPVSLSGYWKFYYGQLFQDPAQFPPESWTVRVPAIWDGYINPDTLKEIGPLGAGTFYLRILLPENLPEEPLALRVPQQGTAYLVYINGELLGGAGSPGLSQETSIPDRINHIFELPRDSESILDLVVQVSNFHHADGGIWYDLQLGKKNDVERIASRASALEVFSMGAMIFAGLYHLGLFFYRRKEPAYLLMGLFLLMVGYRIFTTGELWIRTFFPDLDWTLQLRLEYLGAYLTPTFFILFFLMIFNEWGGRWMFRGSAIILFVFVLPVLVTTPLFFSSTLWINQTVSFFYIPYLFIIQVRALIKRKPGAVAAILGFTIAMTGFINDSLHSQDVIHTAYIGPYTVFGFVLFQTMILVSRFSDAHQKAELLAIELEKKVVERTRSLEETTAQKRQLIHILSHDLRNTLSVILGAAEIIHESGVIEKSNETDARSVEMILRNSGIGLNLLEDVNRLEALETEKIQISLKPVKLYNVFQSANYLIEGTKQRKGIRVKVDIPEQLAILADPDFLISTIFGNLLSNAIKFSHPDGEVRVRALERDDRVMIVIEDDGIGIPEHILKSLFDLSVPTSRKGTMGEPGTGFGMPLVKRFVESMEGTLNILSKEGKGTRVEITFLGSHQFSREKLKYDDSEIS